MSGGQREAAQGVSFHTKALTVHLNTQVKDLPPEAKVSHDTIVATYNFHNNAQHLHEVLKVKEDIRTSVNLNQDFAPGTVGASLKAVVFAPVDPVDSLGNPVYQQSNNFNGLFFFFVIVLLLLMIFFLYFYRR